ncbi:MAG: branched-chain amino acid ABC transporter substrate-binding protein [Acidimicrobiales bacterium]
MRTKSIAAIGFCALVAVATLAAGCSSSSKSSDTIRIGLEAPITGSLSELGQGMLNGAEQAAEQVNANGGIGGKKIEIIAIDDKGDPDAGVAAANKAVKAGLQAVVGPYNSGVGLKTLPIYTAAGLVPLRLTSSDETAGMGFTLQPMTSQIAPVATDALVKQLKATSVALIVDSTTDYTKAAAQAMTASLGKAGVAITATESITPGAKSYADTVTKVLAANPSAVYVITYYPEAGLIAQAMLASKTSANCLTDYGAYDNGYITAAGIPAAQKCPVVGVPSPAEFPNSASLVAAYTKQFNAAPGSWSPYTYDSVMLLADAISRAGGTSAAELKSALAATTGWKGWTGTVAFDATTGNRIPAPVTVNQVTSAGIFQVDPAWIAATGFTY